MSVPQYIPARNTTVDPIGVADELSESLITSYGRWYPENIKINLASDGTNKATRISSIHASRGANFLASEPAGTDSFYFTFDHPQNLSSLNKFSFASKFFDRYIDNTLTTNPILAGYSAVGLGDENGIVVYSPIFNHSVDQKTQFSVYEFTKDEFSGSSSFDWTKVKNFVFYIGKRPSPAWYDFQANGYDVWIDSGPFVLLMGNQPVINIACQTVSGQPISGKSAILTNHQTNAQSPLDLPASSPASAGDYTIRIVDSDFIQWDDGDTNSSKEFALPLGGTFSITAIFSGSDNTNLMILVGVAAVVLGGAGYLAIRKKKV